MATLDCTRGGVGVHGHPPINVRLIFFQKKKEKKKKEKRNCTSFLGENKNKKLRAILFLGE
jgi:hypothetical protein